MSPQGQQNKSFLRENKWISLIDSGSHLLTVVEHKAGQRTGGIMNTRKTGLLCF